MKKIEKNQVLTSDLRESLKNIMKDEIKKIPETLESLEPKDRLNVLCKLIPYVFPKVESVSSKEGEPWQL